MFVSDSAQAAAAGTSQGAAETALDKVPGGFLTFTPNHVFSGPAQHNLLAVAAIDHVYLFKLFWFFSSYLACASLHWAAF